MNCRTRNWMLADNEKALKVDGVHWSLAHDCFVIVINEQIVLKTEDVREARARLRKEQGK